MNADIIRIRRLIYDTITSHNITLHHITTQYFYLPKRTFALGKALILLPNHVAVTQSLECPVVLIYHDHTSRMKVLERS